MWTRMVPAKTALLFAAFAVLLALTFKAQAAPVVVGSIKCLDCSPNDVNAEDAFKGLQVAIKCKSGAGETYDTQMLGQLDNAGTFSIPLAAELLRDDGDLDRDCFAQLHSSPDKPCAGQAPPKIAPAGPNKGEGAITYLAVAEDTINSPVACKCGKFKKKFMFHGPPPPRPEPRPVPEPSYGPPTPNPTPVPEPSYGPPTPKPPVPPVEDEPKPFFHKHPKMKKFMKKKPCPPLLGEDKPEPKN